MARGRRRKCKCCRRLFLPDPRNLRHQRYCSQPLFRAASKAGLPNPRTTTTSAGPFTSPAARPGERVIPATRARPRARALRLKTSQRRKTLVSLAELAISCAHCYKIS